MKQRILSVLLALVLVLSLVPATAFAADPLPDYVPENGGYGTGDYANTYFVVGEKGYPKGSVTQLNNGDILDLTYADDYTYQYYSNVYLFSAKGDLTVIGDGQPLSTNGKMLILGAANKNLTLKNLYWKDAVTSSLSGNGGTVIYEGTVTLPDIDNTGSTYITTYKPADANSVLNINKYYHGKSTAVFDGGTVNVTKCITAGNISIINGCKMTVTIPERDVNYDFGVRLYKDDSGTLLIKDSTVHIMAAEDNTLSSPKILYALGGDGYPQFVQNWFNDLSSNTSVLEIDNSTVTVDTAKTIDMAPIGGVKTINIKNNSVVTASASSNLTCNSKYYMSAIGGMFDSININNSTVNAHGGHAAGIGTGHSSWPWTTPPTSTISITDSIVNASSINGAAIGNSPVWNASAGYLPQNIAIDISGNSKVVARSVNGAAIGVGMKQTTIKDPDAVIIAPGTGAGGWNPGNNGNLDTASLFSLVASDVVDSPMSTEEGKNLLTDTNTLTVTTTASGTPVIFAESGVCAISAENITTDVAIIQNTLNTAATAHTPLYIGDTFFANLHKDFRSVARTANAGTVNDGGQVNFDAIPAGTYSMTYGSGDAAKPLISRVDPMYGTSFSIANGQINRFWTQAVTPISGSVKITDGTNEITAADAGKKLVADVSSVVPGEAVSGGLISYQWYKDDVAITDATDATYTPVAGGVYHCVVSGNQVYGGSVQSGVVTVTGPHAHDDSSVYDTEWSGAMAATTISTDTNIVLTDNVTFSGAVTISSGATVNLCLNGKTIALGGNTITNKGTLNVCDCGEGGKITADTTITSYGVVVNYGTFTMTSGTLERPNKAYGLENYGEATISGGTLYGASSGIRNRLNGSLTITGGTITCNDGYALQTDSEKEIIISDGNFSGRYALFTNPGSTGNIHISGGTFEGTGSGINLQGTGTVFVSNGTITGKYGIYIYAAGNVNMSGGTITATNDYGIYNYHTGKVTVSGGNITAVKYGIYNNKTGSVEMTGGTITGTSASYSAIYNYAAGSISVSGGTITSKTTGIINRSSGSVAFSGATMTTDGSGIINQSSGSITVTGGTITSIGKVGIYGIINKESGTVTVSGGTIKGETFGIDNSGVLYLSGSPSISNNSNGNGDILHRDGSTLYAVDQSGVKYTGELLEIRVFKPSEGKEIVLKVDDSNKDKFTLVNTDGDYLLKQSGENLVLGLPHSHSWSAEWSSDGDYHWHECMAVDCDVTQNSQKGSYGAHTPENDDGNCTTAIQCSACKRELTAGATAHSFTNKASQTIASAADCQNRAKHYVQCDNCNAVSDTSIVEVGELGDHDWDTEWSKDGDNHWHKCLVAGCTEIKDEKAHFSTGGNVATYTKRAICDACGKEYGAVRPDDVKPTGTIAVGGNNWAEFVNTITFDVFFKAAQRVEITTSDVGLGVSKAEYIFTEAVYADADAVLNDTGIAWQALTLDADGKTDFNIVPNEKGIVYLKITDKAGNVTVIRSNGIVLDSDAPVIAGIENGKTYCGPVEVTVSDEYFDKVTVDGSDVTVVNGKFTVTPATDAQEIKAYDKAGNVTTITITVNDGHSYIYDESTADTIVEKCLHCDFSASAQIKAPTGDLVYNGSAHNATVDYTGTLSCGNDLVVSYGTATDTVNAGEYTASITHGGKTASVKYTVNRAKVTLPTIGGKVYTGETLTADIQDAEFYTVTKNDGGIDVGLYDVTLTLKDPANCKWADSDETAVTLKFEITKAANEWVGDPVISGWTYGDAANAPVATAKFGVVDFKYCDTEGTELTDEPKDAGNYKVKVFVPGTDNYTGLTMELPFTIGQRGVTVKWTAPGSLVYDGTAKAPFVKYDQGPIAGDEPEIRFALTDGCDNVNAGTFTFTATGINDSNYVLSGELVSPQYTITARPLQAGDFSTAIDGLVYTGSAITPAVESTTALVTAEDYTVAYESNVGAGENTAKIIITGKRNAAGSVEIPFSIAKADYPNIVWPQNLVGNHGDKLSTVPLLEGFAWEKPDEVIKYGNGHEYAVIFTPEDIANYKVAQGFATVNGADVTAPTGTVTIGTNSWNALWNDITFGLFFKETQTVTVTAADDESGITATEYYLADEKTEDFTDVQWTAFDGSFDINPNNKYVVYIRITNGAGYKTIINSNGVVLDSSAPAISGIENGKDVYGDAVFTISEDNLAAVTVDGNAVTAVDGRYTITADNAEHTVVVTDRSGNRVQYTITVYKVYTVTFVADGKTVEKQPVGHGWDAVLPTVPAKAGYTAAWNADGKNITADVTITAVYTQIPQTEPPAANGPAVNIPNTGDATNLWLWAALTLAGALGLAVTAICAKKRKTIN